MIIKYLSDAQLYFGHSIPISTAENNLIETKPDGLYVDGKKIRSLQPVIINDDYIAKPYEYLQVFLSNNTNLITITLPNDPDNGDQVVVHDALQVCGDVNFPGKEIRVDGNGKGIDDSPLHENNDPDADIMIINLPGSYTRFVYSENSNSWLLDVGGKIYTEASIINGVDISEMYGNIATMTIDGLYVPKPKISGETNNQLVEKEDGGLYSYVYVPAKATNDETISGIDSIKFTTPAGVKAAIKNSILNTVTVNTDVFQAVKGQYLQVFFPEGTTSIDIILPTSADLFDGDKIVIHDFTQKCHDGIVINVLGNGSGIGDDEPGDSDTLVMNLPGAYVTLTYNNAIRSWGIDIGGLVYDGTEIDVSADANNSIEKRADGIYLPVSSAADRIDEFILTKINTVAPIKGGGTLEEDRVITIDYASTVNPGVIQFAESTDITSNNKAITPLNAKNMVIDHISQLDIDFSFTTWKSTRNYTIPSLVFGSNGILYKCIQENGPDTISGTRDPIAANEYWERYDTSVVGDIQQIGTLVAPVGYIRLDGSEQLRADYPVLWSFVENSNYIVDELEWASNTTKYSRGNGLTTFRLPDMTNALFPQYVKYR